MSYSSALQSLEKLLESFLDRAVISKRGRLDVLGGINRLDDIARASKEGKNVIESIGEWFADHDDWIVGDGLRRGDINRIDRILAEINRGLSTCCDSSPAVSKIQSELERWRERTKVSDHKVILKRGPEALAAPAGDTILQFGKLLDRLSSCYKNLSSSKQHLLSALEETLNSAAIQKSKDDLLLSAFIIYYLKQNNYRVDPYVRRLKEAEAVCRKVRQHA